MGKCSFGKLILNDIFETDIPFGTNLEGRLMYIEDKDSQWLLVAFDLGMTFRSICKLWIKGISKATGIPKTNIWYHELQTHAAPLADELNEKACEKLMEMSIPVIQDMMEKASEAWLSYIILDLDGKFNYNREQYIPELGAVTVWAGMEFDKSGRPYSQNDEIMLLDGYKPQIAAFEKPIYFDRPADPQGVLMVFKSKEGEILGSLSRFAAHPDVAVLFDSHGVQGEFRYNFDWPGYLRKEIERNIGGICVYINGPCGNISIKKGFSGMNTYEACDGEAKRIGEEIAQDLLQQWSISTHNWEDIKLGKIAATDIELPMRDSVPSDMIDIIQRDKRLEVADKALRTAIANNEIAAKIKKLIDEKLFHNVLDYFITHCNGLTESELKNRLVKIQLEAISLNGLVFAGLPGESLTETCEWLKAQSEGNNLIVLDQVNGYLGYMTTPESYDQGGYSYWGGWLSRDAERNMRKRALELIRSLKD